MATIYFDLDGTVYDLYGVTGWLERITTQADPTAYSEGRAFYPQRVLSAVLDELVAAGHTIGVVSWLAGGASPEYNKAVRAVKRAWVKEHMPQATEIHIVKYGTPKHHVVRVHVDAILVDDNAEVREAWTRGDTIDASQNILPALLALLK